MDPPKSQDILAMLMPTQNETEIIKSRSLMDVLSEVQDLVSSDDEVNAASKILLTNTISNSRDLLR